MKIKIFIDFLMTILLLLLMAYQVAGESLHEWLGAGMLLLFFVHNVLNRRWYGSLLKGKYKPTRIFRTAVNLALLIAMLCMAYSGIIMSRYVFASLPINSGMALARVMHLAGAYWSFVLMSLHLGLHWSMAAGLLHSASGEKCSTVFLWIFRLFAVVIAGHGAVGFWKADCLSYMFLKVEFAFLDYEKSAAAIFIEYITMMGFWVFLGYYASKFLGTIEKIKWKKKGYM